MKKKIWKFKLDNDFSVDLKKYGAEIRRFIFFDEVDGKWRVVGEIKNGVLKIVKGYEWDGNTPKVRLFGKIVGIPDFPETWEASLIHDFLIEYCHQHDIPRKIIDMLYEAILREKKFAYAPLYSWGVHSFRPISLKFWPCN